MAPPNKFEGATQKILSLAGGSADAAIFLPPDARGACKPGELKLAGSQTRAGGITMS